ncbi:MAG TPA: nucleotide exchange factor GrpE [Candidatus Thermoplasmatota archaeon]|nr:nucleotide exchange factor GrpE [Candidatus Thermoplasmatota archaeon]
MAKKAPAPTPSPAPPPAPDAAADLERVRAEAAELKEKWLRARADYDNLQKRTARDAAAERGRQRARILESFLPLLELAHMAAHQAEAHPGPVSEGVVLLGREFDRFLEREGVVRTGAVGEVADPARHEVVAEEAAGGVPPGAVSRVVAPGYLLGDKVLRFAKVCVAPMAATKR